MDRRRWIIAILMGVILVFTYLWMQGLYDDSDVRKALTLVRSFSGGQVEREIEKRHAGAMAGPPRWSAEIQSGFWGHVRVRCEVALTDGSTVRYEFHANLSAKSIHPANEEGRSILVVVTSGTASPPSL